MHPSLVPRYSSEKGEPSYQESSVEHLNDKPTAVISKAPSIHNFEFNLIRHPANFITYLTGLLIQFTLQLLQITALGPTSVGNALEDALGKRLSTGCSPKPTHSPDTQHFSWDRDIYHILGFMPSFFYLNAEKSRAAQEEKETKKNPQKADLSLLMFVHARQSSSLLHSCQIFLFDLRNTQK